MSIRLLPPFYQVVDANGRPQSGARLYTYESGTSTPLATYADAGLTITNTNPVLANAAGMFPDIFADESREYHIVLRDRHDVTITDADPVGAKFGWSDMPVYPSRTAALLFASKTNGEWLRTEGYAAGGDGGGSLYRWVASAPKPGYFAAVDATGYFEPVIAGLCVPEIFGAVPEAADKWVENTAAFTDFFAFLNSFAAAPQDGYTTFGWHYPGGHLYGKKYWLGNVKILTRHLTALGNAKLVIHPDADPEPLCSSVDMAAPGITRLRWTGITFQGAGLHAQNDNIDAGEFILDNCKFFDTPDYAVHFEDCYSTVPVLSNCQFMRCNGILKTDCDRTTIEHSWLLGHYVNWDDDRAQIKMTGQPGRGFNRPTQVLILNNLTCVPVVLDATPTRQVVKPRWLDLDGELQATAVRSGGENGGIPFLRHMTPYEGSPSPQHSRGGSIVWSGGDLYCLSSQADDGVSWGSFIMHGHLPTNIHVSGVVGPIGAVLIRNDSNFISSFDTYFSTWRSATGRTDETEYFRWHIDMSMMRPAARMWPTGLSKLVRQPQDVTVATAYRTATQNVTAGASATDVQLTDVGSEDDNALFSASDNAFKVRSAGWYFVSGQVRTNQSGAADNTCQATVRKNGANTLFGSIGISTAASQALSSVVSGLVSASVGDLLGLGVIKTGNNDVVGTGTSNANYLSIVGPIRRAGQ